ncbi:acyltransferase family protein [Alteribacillus sp. HJP-4]|uniref:acyltransferase family protein n=1 Tax=Alteribacillus sp. HJP-4 TaxID=2775394 RepID=UPI0035CD3BBD
MTDQAAVPGRDYFFDNAKFILIALVVVTHALTPLIGEHQFARAIYLFLFTFHMPLFFLISGYFAKSAVKKKVIWKPVQKLLLPYFIFQIIYAFYYVDVYGDPLEFRFLTPHWSLWFLVSLFSFYLLIHVFFKKSPYMIIVAVALGIGIGYTDWENFMSIGRTFTFFPFFLAGYFMERRHFSFVFQPLLKVICPLLMLAALVIFYIFAFDVPHEWFYGSDSYQSIGFEEEYAAWYRMLFYVLCIAMSIAFLAVVPQQKLSISTFARNTIYVYLLHGFLFRYLRETPFYESIDTVFEVILLIVWSFLFTFMLSTSIVEKMMKPVIDPFAFYDERKKRKHPD